MYKSICYIILFFFSYTNLKAQQANNWYFPFKAGLNFNTTPPTVLTNGQNVFAGAATISDFNGNLLFYTDGITVFNKNHNVMNNGTFLFGSTSASNANSVIIPFPNDSSKYYLITHNNENLPSSDGYWYHIIDMKLQSGLGEVISKNNLLYIENGEKMTVIQNGNGSGYWLITMEKNKKIFRNYKIDCNGINTNPVIDTLDISDYLLNNLNSVGGEIKASSANSLVCVNYFIPNGQLYLVDFNKFTGKIINSVKINNLQSRNCEFSSNGKNLYLSRFRLDFKPVIEQYDVSILNATTILNSRITIDSAAGFPSALCKILQIGPDNKIYCSSYSTGNVFYIINNPNNSGAACNFSASNLSSGNPNFQNFLPFFVPSLISNQNVQITYTVNPDCRTVNFTGKTYIKGSNLAFKWKFTPTDSITQNVPSGGDTTFANTVFTFPPGIDSFNVQLFVTSDTVCGLGRAGKLVVVKPPPPKANFGYSNTCNNLNVIFTDSSLLNFNPSLTYTYAYKPALAPASAYVNFAVMANTNFSFPSYDSFDVRLIVRSPLSCVQQDTLVKRIVLSPKPIAGFTYNNNCGSRNVTITNTATIAAGSISSYQYFFNGVATSSSANYIFNAPNFGAYNLQQVVTSSAGCISDTFSLPIIVKAKPIVNVTTLNDSVCQNTNYTLTANATVDASTITNYTWLKNNTAIVNNTNTQTENNITGVYTYKLVAQAATDCSSDTAIKIITVASKPTISLNATNNCGSKLINIASTVNVVNDNITQYYITYGDGNSSNTNPNNTNYTYANYGTYTLKYVASGSAGCISDTAYFTIAVKDKPIATITYNNNACQNTNYILTANTTVNASTITNYTWLKNNIVQANNTNTLTENNSVGTYVYQLIANAANGCKSDTVTQNVLVEQYPTVNFNAINGCTNANILITNNSINNNTSSSSSLQFLWATNDGQTSINVLPNFSFVNAGTKTITLKASTANNCADSATITITIEDNPTANFTITEACLGKPITVNNTSTGSITNYAWATNNGQSNNALIPIFIFNTQGNYTLTLNTNTLNNCTATKTENIIIQAVQLFTTPAVDTNIIINQSLQLNISGAANYTWLPPLNLNSNSISNPIFTAAAAGTTNYQIEGITAQGCKGNASLKVNVFAANNYVLIPNAFTPNADGLNDRLRITCTGLQKLNYFTIYNRWGNMVYTQNNCNQNGWDGKLLGVLQPNATFVYNWSGIDFMGKKVNGKGTVTLIR